MADNYRKSNSGPFLRSLSPPRRFYSPKQSSSSAFASSTMSARTSQLLHRSTSPTRVTLFNPHAPSAHSVRFTLDRRESSPNRSVSFSSNRNQVMSRKPAGPSQTKRTCSCSPTNHPGSFRCSLHRNGPNNNNNNCGSSRTASFGCNKLERSAMVNSLVRIGAVEGDLVKRALAALIRPSSHQLRRRQNFRRRPSRLSVMSKAE